MGKTRIAAGRNDFNERTVTPDHLLALLFTSGTMGNSKGVMLTQENFISEVSSILTSIHADETDTFLCLLPLQHVFASVVNFLLPLYIGAEVTFVDTLKRKEILEALEEAGITILATVPQFFYLFHGRIQEELRKKPKLVQALFRVLLVLPSLLFDEAASHFAAHGHASALNSKTTGRETASR
jgi:long-chain acyl-CoA synthetase